MDAEIYPALWQGRARIMNCEVTFPRDLPPLFAPWRHNDAAWISALDG